MALLPSFLWLSNIPLHEYTTSSLSIQPLMHIQVVSMSWLGFPGGSDDKEPACNARDMGQIPGLERSPGDGKGYPLQYSGLENSTDCIVHGVAKSWA